MKNAMKVFVLAVIVLGFAGSSFAQSSVTAEASATMVAPLSIAVTTNMDFGTLAATATAGTATLDYLNGLVVSAGVEIIGGAPKTAVFTVTGQASESISVSFPTSIVLTDGTNNMTVNGISCEETATTSLNGSGVAVLHVKGVLNVLANQPAGSYTNVANDFTVTVNYN